jgi:hypothetical protein
VSRGRCSELSREAGESLAATATTAERWLLVEVPGTWPRDVSEEGGLPDTAREVVSSWLERTPHSRALFVRRPGSPSSPALVFVIEAGESSSDVRRIELARAEDLAEVDLDSDGDPTGQSLVLVCGHGTRDACCAVHGTAVHRALAGRLDDVALWISSHQGGHRFAANVLVLPAGLQFGRVEPGEAAYVVARALAGRIELGRYRGRTCYESPTQAAERAVREATGLDGIADLRLVGTDGPTVRFRSWDGSEYAAQVAEIAGPRVPASCGVEPEAQQAFSARVL